MEYKIRGTNVTMPYATHLTPAETRLVFSLTKIFPAQNIRADYYLPKELVNARGQTMTLRQGLLQIDCLAVDASGIYVFESKDYSGWIYGHAERKYWTQVLNFGQDKEQFYSPVRQNAAHVAAVRDLVEEAAHSEDMKAKGSGLDARKILEVPIYSIIVFGRETELKVVESLPADCVVCTQATVRRVVTQLQAKTYLSEGQVDLLCRLIDQGGVNPDALVRTEHVEEVKKCGRV